MIKIGLQMVRVFCCVIIKVMGATSKTRVVSSLESTIEQKAWVSFSEFFCFG